MKTRDMLLVILLLLGCCFSSFGAEHLARGDVTGDGQVSALDAAAILKYIVGLQELTEPQIRTADVSRNGSVTPFDATLILQYIVGKIASFPQIIKDITPQEAFEMMQANKGNEHFIVLDVRTAAEYATERIEGTINLDFFSPNFREELDKFDKNDTIIIHCASGGRSSSALKIAQELGFAEAYNMLGGINGWKAAGLPTVR